MSSQKDPHLIAFARANRQFDNPTAKRLWAHLRSRRTVGAKWRREHIIEPYIADFFCAAAGLVVELDGESHAGKAPYDARRDEFFESQGLMVIRISNLEAQERWDDVMNHICLMVETRMLELGRGSNYRIPD